MQVCTALTVTNCIIVNSNKLLQGTRQSTPSFPKRQTLVHSIISLMHMNTNEVHDSWLPITWKLWLTACYRTRTNKVQWRLPPVMARNGFINIQPQHGVRASEIHEWRWYFNVLFQWYRYHRLDKQPRALYQYLCQIPGGEGGPRPNAMWGTYWITHFIHQI